MSNVYHPRTAWETGSNIITGPGPKGTRANWVIHYPGGGSSHPIGYAQMVAYCRSMNSYYLSSRGYALGYNFIVSQDGTAMECRGVRYNNAANAGRKVEGNFNAVSMSIMIAVANADAATPAAIAKVKEIIALHGPTWEILGHRDVDATSCPGDAQYAQIKSGAFDGAPEPAPEPEPEPEPAPEPPPVDAERYDPPKGYYSTWPTATWIKPTRVGLNDQGWHVHFFQDVMRWETGLSVTSDGVYGEKTADAIALVQDWNGLTVDRYCGPQTIAVLQKYAAKAVKK